MGRRGRSVGGDEKGCVKGMGRGLWEEREEVCGRG